MKRLQMSDKQYSRIAGFMSKKAEEDKEEKDKKEDKEDKDKEEKKEKKEAQAESATQVMTHHVSLIIENDYGEYSYWMEEVQEQGLDVHSLAEAMESFYVDQAIEAESGLSGVSRELLSVALNFVDWREVADSLLTE